MSIRINSQTGIDVGDLPISNAGNAELAGTDINGIVWEVL